MGFGDERGDGGYRESFLSHYAADVTVPQPSEPVCPHHESAGSCPVFGCPHHQPDGSQS